MKIERAILIAFIGNYLINNVVAAIAAFVPAGTSGSMLTPQYLTFVVLAAITVAILTWWYRAMNLNQGIMFGVLGFVVAIVSAFITGVSGVLVQTASFSTLMSVLPNFGPFLMSWSTLWLLGYWVVPAALVGFFMRNRMKPMVSASSMQTNPNPMRTM